MDNRPMMPTTYLIAVGIPLLLLIMPIGYALEGNYWAAILTFICLGVFCFIAYNYLKKNNFKLEWRGIR